jgi:hypothetical protein
MTLKNACLSVIAIILSYYLAVILHEWGHGTVAWLYGYKEAFYDVRYGGWFLLNVDENVPYNQILAAHRGTTAALIGIAGLSVSTLLFLISLFVLKRIKHGVYVFTFFYWFLVFNMIPIIQYLSVQTFSIEGDAGRFVHGLNISPLWIFIPGVIFIVFALIQVLKKIVPRAYARLDIHALWAQRLFLLISLGIMFLWIYAQGYNPLSDPGMPYFGKVLACISMALVPILFFLCNPSREWVKREINHTL